MSDLYQDIAPHPVALGQIYKAVISSPPTAFDDAMDILIPDVHPDLVFSNVRWQARDNQSLPSVGDDVLVIFDNNNEPWVVTWWPTPRNPKVTIGLTTDGPPASPVDGDIWIPKSPTGSGNAWQFVYDASWAGDPYKWKFIGGAEAYQQITVNEDRPASSGIGDLTTMGPSIAIPRAGLYFVRWGSLVNTHNSQQGGYAGMVISSHPGGARMSVYEADMAATAAGFASAMTQEQITVASPQTIKMQYFASTNQAVTFQYRWLSVVPLRVI